MARKPQLINLSSDELRSLKTSLRKGTLPARVQTRARVMDLLHRQHTPSDIAAVLQVGIATIFNIKRRYLAEGLDAALIDRPRSGQPCKIDGVARAKITALACSTAPIGHARSLAPAVGGQRRRTRLLRKHLAQHGSRGAEKNRLQPHRKRSWCIGAITGEYLARMEDVLHLYNLPLDEVRPIVCFDELPVQLLGEVVMPLRMKAGQPTRFDYEYERAGTGSLLVAFEPLTGRRYVETSKQRTKADYCRFMQRVAASFPQAEKIVPVQDNLNTHHASSFYENLLPAEAFALAQRFEMHDTPKKGSWLNIAELELSALARICLSRRISTMEELDREIQSLVKERNELKIKVEWQFSIMQAREKLSRHYEKVQSKN